MSRKLFRLPEAGLALLLLAIAATVPALAAERVAIKGYDPVAYFTESRPVKGSPEISHAWHDSRWHFATAEHREMFRQNPERYAPQYAGYCAFGVAKGMKVEVDPQAWAIVGDKLYLNYNSAIKADWEKDRVAYIDKANEQWPKLR